MIFIFKNRIIKVIDKKNRTSTKGVFNKNLDYRNNIINEKKTDIISDIKKTYVINLKRRPDRLAKFKLNYKEKFLINFVKNLKPMEKSLQMLRLHYLLY